MEESGRNRTPDKLKPAERAAIQAICDQHLAALVKAVQPKIAVGVGAYAEQAFQRVIKDESIQVMRILHPSPASPAANKNWAGTVTEQLKENGMF
jgi:single-strand selective monofunctional uracil DNA glycosylase